MSRRRFSEEERKELESNPFIAKVTAYNVLFTKEFKQIALDRYKQTGSPHKVFQDLGVPDFLNQPDYAHYAIKRFKKIAYRDGDAAFSDERRGRSKPALKSLSKMSEAEKDARIAYLEAENDFLKKLKALG